MEVAKSEDVKMCVKKNLVLTASDEHVTALLAILSASMERKVTLKEDMKTVGELFKSDGSAARS